MNYPFYCEELNNSIVKVIFCIKCVKTFDGNVELSTNIAQNLLIVYVTSNLCLSKYTHMK